MIAILAQETDRQLSELIDGAGPVTGLFVLLLVVALIIIFRSMAKQMRKINPDLPLGPEDRQQAEGARAIDEAIERGSDGPPKQE
jgi:hypothetical protein